MAAANGASFYGASAAAAPPPSSADDEVFTEWSEFGKRYLAQMLRSLRYEGADKETSTFLVDVLVALLASSVQSHAESSMLESAAASDRRREANLAEQRTLARLQEGLADAGALDVIIDVVSASRDVAARTPSSAPSRRSSSS